MTCAVAGSVCALLEVTPFSGWLPVSVQVVEFGGSGPARAVRGMQVDMPDAGRADEHAGDGKTDGDGDADA
jgi:hypothetical protein